MERTTIKTILLIIISGVGGILLFIGVMIGLVYIKIAHHASGSDPMFTVGRTISFPPPFSDTDRFRGSYGRYAGDFNIGTHESLANGPGKIIGHVMVNDKPVAGLRLTLALNGSVISQQASTDVTGQYVIGVPYGRYRIDGYNLDPGNVNKILPGKTDGPRDVIIGTVMTIDAENPGKGPELTYVDVVRKIVPARDVTLASPIIAHWQPYPGASEYKIQLIEQKHPGDYRDRKELYNWSSRPVVPGTSLNLSQHHIKLKKGYYYTIQIDALDSQHQKLSDSGNDFDQADFHVKE